MDEPIKIEITQEDIFKKLGELQYNIIGLEKAGNLLKEENKALKEKLNTMPVSG